MSDQKPNASFSSMKKVGRMIIIVLIIGLLVNILLSFLFGFQNISAALAKVRWEHVLVPFAIFIVIYIIDALRLVLVLKQFNYTIKFGDAFVNALMGYFFSYLTPMATGGQPFQIYHLKKLGIDGKTSTNIIMTRFIEYLASAIILTLVLIPTVLPLLRADNAQTTFLIIGFSVSVAASVLVAVLFIRPDGIGRLLKRLEKTFLGRFISKLIKKKDWGQAALDWSHGLKENIAFLWKEKLPIVLIDTLLCVVVLGLQVFSLTWILVRLVGAELSFLHIFATVLLLNLVVYYIPSPGASGGLEGAFTAVFTLYTGQPQLSFIAVTVWRFATYYLQIFFGLGVFLFMRRRGGLLADAPRPEEPPADE